MHILLFQGNRLETTDEVALAVVDYAAVLARTGKFDDVSFPVVFDGVISQCRSQLGPGAVWTAVSIPDSLPGEIDGSTRAAEDIRSRRDELVSSLLLEG
ncbi:hypothetical protein [Agromyces aerolatus]|uniref:hypothetical protein n=1 Tax=Agromyces sp. LY-1074 TaxID=3074080 RepID=UPI002866AE8A|nr:MULTISPECIES: hypothetical protein [unclassified Agromyces]MDR5699188.1 hypothetical protein [Agromyces sp. LY-1074]MDR5705483.1 hypothetical protein [Agromyces sp. LY-1358]